MRTTSLKLSGSPIAALLILNIALLLALLLVILAAPVPRIEASFGGATVEISADRSWTLLPGQCAVVSWDLEGIQSVYVNGSGKVGQGTMEFCPAPGAAIVSFNVTAGDGSSQTFLLPVHDLASYAGAWLPMLGILLPLIVAIRYLATMRLNAPPFHYGSAIPALVALLLTGLLLQAAQPALISMILDRLESVAQSRAWHLLGSVLAAAIYVPLAIQLFHRGRIHGIRADLVAVGACFAVMALLYSQAGFDSIGQWETWPLQAYFEGRPSKASAELVSRFWVLTPHVLASTISWHSFAGYHLVNFFMLWGASALFYGILRQLGGTPWLAFLTAILFLAYPVNSNLMSLRSLPHMFNKLALLAALFLILDARSNISRLGLLGIWLALLFNLGSYEIGFVIILLAPLLWWRRDRERFWRNLNLTLIWYLVPVAKVAQLRLLNLSDANFYGQWNFALSPGNASVTLDNVRYYLDIIANAYLRTFVYGWQEALEAVARNDWIAPTALTLALVGIVSAYLARDSRPEDFPSRKNIIAAFLGGIAFILPSIGVVMWLARRAYGLWRMYVYAPIGAAVALLALVALAALPLREIRLRQALVIGLGLLLIFPGLSRLYVQQGWFVDSANAKARILLQIAEQAPYFDANARLMLMTYMSSDTLREMGIKELDTNMFDSAMYMMYQEGRPKVAFFCIVGEYCGSSDIDINRDFFETGDDFSDVAIFLLREDLQVELLEELPPELLDRGDATYDPTSLIDAAAPIPPRALSMLASAHGN